MRLTELLGVYPRDVIEATLPLEYPAHYEAGLLVSWCPGVPTDGREYRPHQLRVKIIAQGLVDVCCPFGCDPKMLAATIADMRQVRNEE